MKAKNTDNEAPPLTITAEERYHLINDAAYFRSLQHKAKRPAGQAESWSEVESEIDKVLKKHHMKARSGD